MCYLQTNVALYQKLLTSNNLHSQEFFYFKNEKSRKKNHTINEKGLYLEQLLYFLLSFFFSHPLQPTLHLVHQIHHYLHTHKAFLNQLSTF